MTDVIKKGLLEVKKRGRFGGYKAKYVLLSNSLTLKCKIVEILDTDGSKNSVEVIRLTDIWSVQDKPSRSRYAFELVLGEDPVMTFSCATVVEREEWTEAFRVLNQLALPSMDTVNASSPLTEYFSVTLMKNRSALEIGHSGQYLLSITSSAIVLHWRTGAIAHHWPTKNITKLYHPGREGHLLLIVKRVSSSGPPLDFEFMTDKDSAVQILKVWNIRLLESIPGDPQQLNEISSSLTAAVTGGGKSSKRSSRKSKSFKDRERHRSESEDVLPARSGSFSRFNSYGTGATLGGMVLSQGSQPLARCNRDDPSRSLTEFTESQDSFFASAAPPLPPLPVESSSDEDDPDYAYIDEREVKGPNKVKRTPSIELDDELKELQRSIHRENKAKRRRESERRVHTLQPRSRMEFVPADPQDYLIPVPSKRSQTQSTSSDHSPNAQDLSPSSNECSPVFNPPSLPPRTRTYGVNENTESTSQRDPAPPIPRRSPSKEYLSRKSSSSSSLSSSSSNHRCPKCRSLRKTKSTVSKTVSLDQRTPRLSKEESRKSMPNLDSTEIRARHHHHCCEESVDSSSDQLATPPPSTREYLQLVDSKASELGPELDLLSSCLQTLEGLSKNNHSHSNGETKKKSRNPYDHIKLKTDPNDSKKPGESKRSVETDLDAARRHRPLTHPHKPSLNSQSAFLASSPFSLASQPPRSPQGGMNNGLIMPPRSVNGAPRSHSSLGSAPPVPPRSNVSLTQPEAHHHNGVARTHHGRSLGRSATLQAKHTHPLPPRSNSVLDHTPSYHGNSRYGGYGDGSQVESSGSSSTVFIHHLKDRRLAHMV